MGKHTRKRLRDDKHGHAIPLGAAAPFGDDIDKDDEERRLESLLFGTQASVARRETFTLCKEEVSDSDKDAEVNAAELEGLLDSDVSHDCDLISHN